MCRMCIEQMFPTCVLIQISFRTMPNISMRVTKKTLRVTTNVLRHYILDLISHRAEAFDYTFVRTTREQALQCIDVCQQSTGLQMLLRERRTASSSGDVYYARD